MRSTLIALLFLFAGGVAAQGTLLAVYNNLSRIDVVNSSTGATISQTALTSSQTIFGFTGLAQDPTTGTLYAAVRTTATATDIYLGTINRTAGTVTLLGEFNVGGTGESISSIQFDSTGQLWAISGVAGSGTPNPETLFTCNKANGNLTSFVALGNGQASEALGFDPTNTAVMYHFTGMTSQVFETVNLTTGATNNITITNPPTSSKTILCMAWDSNSQWFWTCTNATNEYGYIRPNGLYVVFGTMAAAAKGMVVLPTINTSTASLNLGTTVQGTAGSAQSFNLTGFNLFGDVTITAPTGVEVSTSAGSGYATSINVPRTSTSGQLASTPIFARIAASATAGNITGNVTLTATGADTKQVSVSGTVTAPEMDVTRGGAITDGGTDAAGGMLVGVGSNLTYTITNSGNATLNMSNAVLGAINNCTPNITTQVPATLASSANAPLVISVTPTTAAAFSFTVSIANDDPNENPYNWTVNGTGLPNVPEMDVDRGGTPVADGSSDPAGTLTIGTTLTLTYTIANNGTNTLTLANAVEGALNNCTVTITTQPSGTVAPSTTTQLVVDVDALAPGAVSFTLSIPNDDPNENPYDWTVTGNGVALMPEMDVTANPSATPVADGGSSSAGLQNVGQSVTLLFTINNSGSAPLTVTVPVTPSSEVNCTAIVTTQPAASVTAGGSTQILVSVTPAAVGAFSFTLSIANDDADENPYDILVSGTAQSGGGQTPSDAKSGSEGSCSSGTETAWLWLLVLLTFGSALLWRLKHL